MTDSNLLAVAYADGVERGLKIALERITAMLGLEPSEQESMAKVIAGVITPEMVEAQRQQEQGGEPAPDGASVH